MLKRSAFVLLSLLSVTAVTRAAVITTVTSLSGPNENPTNNSPGIGNSTVTIDTLMNTLHVQVSFSGLTSGTTASHIHCCVAPPGTATVATTVPTFLNFPLGVTAGSYDQTLDLTMTSSYNPAFVTANGGTVASAEAALIGGITG